MTHTYKISQSLIDKYSAGPSAARTSQVKRLHENIRAALENWGEKKLTRSSRGLTEMGRQLEISMMLTSWHFMTPGPGLLPIRIGSGCLIMWPIF